MLCWDPIMRNVIVFLLMCAATASAADMRIKIVSTSKFEGQPRAPELSEHTSVTYVHGPDKRIETDAFGPHHEPTALIQRCNAHVSYFLHLDTHEYMESPIHSQAEWRKKAEEAAKAKAAETPEPPNLIFETTTVDTGETKRAFGHTAHHYVTTQKQTPSPELQQEPSETVTDAWYLDIPDPSYCEQPSRWGGRGVIHLSLSGDASASKKIRPEFRHNGPTPEGMVLAETVTQTSTHVLATGEKQQIKSTFSREVVEMSDEPIDPALFEVPAGFTKVDHFAPSPPTDRME